MKIKMAEIGGVTIGSLKKKQKTLTGEQITEICAKELSDQATQIAKQESKLAERMDFDNDRLYYMTVIFKSSKEMETMLGKAGIKLKEGDYCFYEDVHGKL